MILIMPALGIACGSLLTEEPDVFRPPEICDEIGESKFLQHRPVDLEGFGGSEIVVVRIARALVQLESRWAWVREVEFQTTPTLGEPSRAQKPVGLDRAIA